MELKVTTQYGQIYKRGQEGIITGRCVEMEAGVKKFYIMELKLIQVFIFLR